MAERRSTRIKKPTAKARRASNSPRTATRHPPTPPPTPKTPATPKSILKGRSSRKRSPAASIPKRVTVSAPLPLPRLLPLQPPRPSEWPSAYLWTPLPQTPLAPLSLTSSARRAKLLLQLLKQRYDFHLHALRPAKEKVTIYRNFVNVLQDELWKLEDWRVESLYDLGVSERRLRGIGGTSGLDRRIGRSHRRVEKAEEELERAERVLRVAERRLGEMEGEWYDLLFGSRDEEEEFAAGDEGSDLGEDTDVDSILALMNLPLAATIQLGSNLEHRAYVDDLSNQLQATRTKMGQLQRELEAAREEVGIVFPQPSPFEFQRRRGTNSSKRGTSDPREHGADDEEQERKERISYSRVARLVGALVSIREREQELEVLLSNAEEHERRLDSELCKRAVMGTDGSMRSPASTIGILSPSTPLTP
ncbi:hypothetical protein CKM354_000649400 [Cercospora kikuchii]|uniref:Uncharacterized protein n=1 Tax=Cercospora kikuchii TaxID=84275 RepID=A0A9P3FGK2_9PEZI|nr:uncharacterized protein CKM354_000649400 [Cercospora kikuchii]GIZ43262.1 hypothetical protein CKM354_000649400 [Cercospora kikuchii]